MKTLLLNARYIIWACVPEKNAMILLRYVWLKSSLFIRQWPFRSCLPSLASRVLWRRRKSGSPNVLHYPTVKTSIQTRPFHWLASFRTTIIPLNKQRKEYVPCDYNIIQCCPKVVSLRYPEQICLSRRTPPFPKSENLIKFNQWYLSCYNN